ncbi:MAG: hypothetical protein JWO51_2346 [Rhodospirillales bacterium]|nr:hypothetical protein [Rhodospirillales bacterium]
MADEIPREIELKLAFRPRDRRRLEQELSGSVSPPQRLVSTYFDTSDRRLAEHGLSLRVRRNGVGRIQTLKALDRGPAAAAERNEWEWRIAGDRPEPALLAETPFAGLLDDSSLLVPRFRTEVDRSVHLLKPAKRIRIEAALDDGLIIAGERQEALHELELELKRGRRDALYDFALRLNEIVPLTFATESKFDRGEALKTGQAAGAAKTATPELGREMPVDRAVKIVLVTALGGLLANLAPTLQGGVEGLHQLRVSLRRLRADLVLFKPLLDTDQARRANDALRRMGRILGDARDWDVFALETLPTIAAKGRTWPHLLLQPAEIKRKAVRATVEDILLGPELTALVLSLAAWIERGLSADDGPVRRVAAGLLDRVARKARKRGKHLRRLDGPELHAVRKSMKKLRYAVAALAPLFDKRDVARYLDDCKSLQKLLGRINDAAAAERLAAETVSPQRKDLQGPKLSLEKWVRGRQRRAQGKLGDAWSDFRAARPFWR